MTALLGKVSSESSLAVNLSGPFKYVDGKRLMISRSL
jgi:hypothetical protein